MMNKVKLLSAVAAAIMMASSAQAITYTVNLNVGPGSVVGSIDTDGTLGVLGTANITSWSLLLNDGTSTFLNTTANSQRIVVGDGFTATSSALFFDFSDDNSAVDFQNPTIGSGINFFCFNAFGTSCTGGGAGMYVATTGSSASLSLQGVQEIGTAGIVPEPATWALLILGFGLTGAAMRRRTTLAFA